MATDKQRLARAKERRETVKADQIGVCRFIEIIYQVFADDGTGKWVRTGSSKARGLQLENKLLMADGSFKYLNNPGVQIITKYERHPLWADPKLNQIWLDYFIFEQPFIWGGVIYGDKG